MKKLLWLLILPCLLFAAQYDVTSVEILPNGWTANVVFEGMVDGGVVNTKMLGYKDSLSECGDIDSNSYFVVKRVSWDSVTTAIDSLYDTVYFTVPLRKIYPNNGSDSTQISGSDLIVTFALSQPIFTADVIRGVVIQENTYTQVSGNTEYDASTATNSSTRTYSEIPVLSNWTRPNKLVVNTDFKLGVIAAHASMRHNRLVKMVKIKVADQSANTYDTLLHYPDVDTSWGYYSGDRWWTDGDSIVCDEYLANIPISEFTKGDTLTISYTAYPWYGDTLSTWDGLPWITDSYTNLKYYYQDGYYAIIDSVAGNDGTGAIAAEGAFNFDSPPYSTIAPAINAARAALGTADIRGLLHVYVKYGGYYAYGTTITAGTASSFRTTIENYPGEEFRILGRGTVYKFPVNSYVKVKGATFKSATSLLTSESGVWIDSCKDSCTAGSLVYGNGIDNFTRTRFDHQMDLPYATTNAVFTMRDCHLNETDFDMRPVLMMGVTVGRVDAWAFDEVRSSTLGHPDGGIMYKCVLNGNIQVFQFGQDVSYNKGYAMINCIFEKTAGTGPLGQIAADESTSDSVRNFIIARCDLIGERLNYGYNDNNLTGVVPTKKRDLWTFKNNIIHRLAVVDDADYHNGAEGAPRTGGWYLSFGVNQSNNILCANVPSGHLPDYGGLNYFKPNWLWDQSGEMNDSIKFVLDGSWTGTGTGFGDYHLQEESPAVNFSKSISGLGSNVMTIDLYGNTVGVDSGAVGPIIYGTEYVPPVTGPVIDSLKSYRTGDTTAYRGDTIAVYGSGFTNIDTGFIGLDTVLMIAPLNDDSLRFVLSDSTDTGTVTIVLTDGVNSDSAYINCLGDYVPPAPSITAQPASLVDSIGHDTALYVTSDYADSYQWERKPKAGGDSTDISGEIYDSLQFTDLSFTDTLYYYRARAINEIGEDTSSWVSIAALWLEPVIGGIVVKAPLRDSTKTPCAREADTVLFVGTIGDYADSAYVNSSGTVAVPILKTEHGALDTAYFVIPDIGVTGMWGFRTRLIFDHGGVRIVSDSPTADNKLYIKGF